jgi:putative chitinase
MMMEVTRNDLLKLSPQYNREWLENDVRTLAAWAEKFGITTKLRMAHFLAQCAHESAGFTAITENLNYSANRLMQVFPKYFTPALATQYARNPEMMASRVYANRMGNGKESTGDGWRYRGRGYIQITGRANYQAYQNSGLCVGNLMEHPEWLTKSPGRMKSAMWYFMKSGCNELADKDNLEAITRRINGGLNGLSNRAYYLRKIKRIFFI